MEETFADGVPAHFDVGIVRVKAAVGRLVRFGDAAHIGDDFIGAKLVFVHMGRIAHQAHDGGFLALAEMHLHSLFLNFLNKRLHALFRCVLLENDNHDFRPPDLLLRFVLLRYSSILPRNKKAARFFSRTALICASTNRIGENPLAILCATQTARIAIAIQVSVGIKSIELRHTVRSPSFRSWLKYTPAGMVCQRSLVKTHPMPCRSTIHLGQSKKKKNER